MVGAHRVQTSRIILGLNRFAKIMRPDAALIAAIIVGVELKVQHEIQQSNQEILIVVITSV